MSASYKRWLCLIGASAMLTIAGSAMAQSQGLLGQYYSWDPTLACPPDRADVFKDANLTGVRVDSTVNFGNPFTLPGTTAHNFAAAWTGFFVPDADGHYSLTTRSDDGIRLWFNEDATKTIDPAVDTPVIDQWLARGEGGDDAPFEADLKKGVKYPIRVEFEECGGGNAARLRYTPPGADASLIIPASLLQPAAVAALPAPGDIKDLAVSATDAASATLTFTAPGESGATGNALAYDVRYSTDPITAANFGQAASFTVGKPSAAGTKETLTVTGLQPLMTYYFAVSAGNKTGAFSNPSNFVSGATGPVATAGQPGGLTAQYYAYDTTLAGSPDRDLVFDPTVIVLTRIDPALDYNFDTNPAPGVPADKFAVRWQGQILLPADGTFNIAGASDDGDRLWLSKTKIDPANPGDATSDNWIDRGDTVDANSPIDGKAGDKFYVLYEMYENGGGAAAHLRWSGPGITGSVPIPGANLISSADIQVAPQGRLIGKAADGSGHAVANAPVTIKQGSLTVNLFTNAQGIYTTLLSGGSTDVSATLPAPYAATASAKVTVNVEAGKINTGDLIFTGAVLLPAGSMSLKSADLGTSGWAFLQSSDVTPFQNNGATDLVKLQADWCKENLSTTGANTITGTSWVQNWAGVTGDVSSTSNTFPAEQQAIDNNYWVQAVHFKTSANLPTTAGVKYTIQDFNVDDFLYVACLNGKLLSSFKANPDDANHLATDASERTFTVDPTIDPWNLNWQIPIPDGALKTDGTDNLLVFVSYQGGGGAGLTNAALGGPRIVAYLPGGGGGVVTPVKGDLNGDGKVNIGDATLALQISVGNITPSAAQTSAGDVINVGDGIKIGDVIKILQVAVGNGSF